MRPEQYSTATLTPVSHTFANLPPDEFGANVDSLWNAARQITDKVTEQVTTEQITPMQGIAITAHVAGVLFGYREFSRELTPSDLALLETGGNGS